MPVKARCQECQKVINAPDKARGKSVKCPQCGKPIPIPSGTKKAPSARADTEDSFLDDLNLDALEDKSATVCMKCGGDISVETGECISCGFHPEKASQKKSRALPGANPKAYTSTVLGDSWAFSTKNARWVIKTTTTWLIYPTLSLGALWLTLWFSKPPLIAFFGLFAFLFAIFPIGWWWFLDLEVIRQTMKKNMELKRFARDTFANVGLGIKALLWTAAIGAQAVVGLAGAVLLFLSSNNPGLLVPGLVCVGLALLVALLLFPIGMAHMAMPVTTGGWKIWVLFPAFGKNLQAVLMWCAVAVGTHIPAIACVIVIGVLYGQPISSCVAEMNYNRQIAFALTTVEYAKENGKDPDPTLLEISVRDKREVAYDSLIPPAVLTLVAFLNIGLMGPFNMRSNGNLVANCHRNLDLVMTPPETTYVSKAEIQKKREEEKAAKRKAKEREKRRKEKEKEKSKK